MKRVLRLDEGLAILKDYRMPYIFYGLSTNSGYLDRPSWNGQNLAVTLDMTTDDVLHELGHWVVAPPERKKIAEYGLGMSFRSRASPRSELPMDVRDVEEEKACCFELAAFWKLGLDWHSVADSVNFYGHSGLGWRTYVNKVDEVGKVVEMLRQERIFKSYAPVNFPSLEDLGYHITEARKEIAEWKRYLCAQESA